jgi:hypothetical protein
MLQKDVKVGEIYRAKVSDKKVLVKISREANRKGWYAINLSTSREVYIRSAARLTPTLQKDMT